MSFLVLTLLIAGCGQSARAAHSCGVRDRVFISTAQLDLSVIGLWAGEYEQGEVEAKDFVQQAKAAAVGVMSTSPSDYSLVKTRKLLDAMFLEYGRAIDAKARHRDAGPHIARAYGLANFAHDVLAEAQPGLSAHGCDVRPLL